MDAAASPTVNGAPSGGFMNLTARDWEGTRQVHLDEVARTATVGELVGQSVQALQLPLRDLYQAVFRGRELNHGDTLEEAGLDSESEIELVPEVSAGAVAQADR
ncbi:MAG: hypothetical protein GY944_07470 [bacterium]|nr:hypothetical protein [bacterium]